MHFPLDDSVCRVETTCLLVRLDNLDAVPSQLMICIFDSKTLHVKSWQLMRFTSCEKYFFTRIMSTVLDMTGYFPLISVSKQKLLFSSTIFYLRSAEYFLQGLHDSLSNTIVIGSWINFRLSICCFVTQYIVVFNAMWSFSNKPSSKTFLTKRK